jgi:hypothetical protein
MKKYINKISLLAATTLFATSCSHFDELNEDPFRANAQQVQVEYFINNSITSAQQDPHIAERVFILYWQIAGHQARGGNLSTGGYSDDWSGDYLRYASEWLNHINTAIVVADEQIESDNIQPYTENLKHVARIWRAYLMSELSDNFGPIPVEAFQGNNPEFNSVQEVYYYLLDELRDATAAIDESIVVPSRITEYDKAYGFDFSKWVRYGNSMRMRLAMRISEVDAAKARTEFEAALATNQYISSADHRFSIQEVDGWNALAGVMSRGWNSQILSPTLNNLYVGLGSVRTQDQVSAAMHGSIKNTDYMGIQYSSHFATITNEPTRGFWLDGLPYTIDPRAYRTFQIPGDVNNPNYFRNGATDDANALDGGVIVLNPVTGANTAGIPLATRYTWNAPVAGNWGGIETRSNAIMQWFTSPVMANNFRNHSGRRVFFGEWESHFLIAEAAVKGWNTPTTGKAAYEDGVRTSLAYFGVENHATTYLASTEYNRVGTSVSWDHTTEPPVSISKTYVNGYTGATGTYTYTYPENTIYRNGTVKNDLLTKIITQKFIANTPWLPLETWSDHRRLGLPFFENPAVVNPLPNMTALTPANVMTNRVGFFPQRVPYPSSLRASDAAAYERAVSLLGGSDGVFTPLWWAKQN